MISLNTNQQARDEIIFDADRLGDPYRGGLKSFSFLTLDKLEQLVNEGFVDLGDRQNNAPSIDKILQFMRSNPDFTAHGYAIDKSRPDYRISIEGVRITRQLTFDEAISFTELFRLADIFEITDCSAYCWFD